MFLYDIEKVDDNAQIVIHVHNYMYRYATESTSQKIFQKQLRPIK